VLIYCFVYTDYEYISVLGALDHVKYIQSHS